mgnify:CR=1 FL=1
MRPQAPLRATSHRCLPRRRIRSAAKSTLRSWPRLVIVCRAGADASKTNGKQFPVLCFCAVGGRRFRRRPVRGKGRRRRHRFAGAEGGFRPAGMPLIVMHGMITVPRLVKKFTGEHGRISLFSGRLGLRYPPVQAKGGRKALFTASQNVQQAARAIGVGV